jgi:predicted Zn-ribbon and HTH transcriptional regulator
VTIKKIVGKPDRIEYTVVCRSCGYKFKFSVPKPAGPFNSHCPKCQQAYDINRRDPAAE